MSRGIGGEPPGKFQLADTGSGGAIRRVAGGPEQAILIKNDALVEGNGNGHLGPGEDQAGSLVKELGKKVAEGGGSAER